MRIEESIEIAAPSERVWWVMTDVERWPEWTASTRSVELVDGGPLAVGTRVRIKQPGFPTAVWTVTEVRDGESFTWENRSPGLKSVGTHTVRPRDAGSTVDLSIEQTGALAGLMKLLFGRRSARYVRMEAEGLKTRSQSPPA